MLHLIASIRVCLNQLEALTILQLPLVPENRWAHFKKIKFSKFISKHKG